MELDEKTGLIIIIYIVLLSGNRLISESSMYFINMAILRLLIFATLVLLHITAGDNLDQAKVQCCSQVFLSSNAGLAASAPFSLGIYTLSGERIASNQHPVYVKHSDTGDHYLYYRKKGNIYFICHCYYLILQ